MFDHVGVVFKDLRRSGGFYTEVLAGAQPMMRR